VINNDKRYLGPLPAKPRVARQHDRSLVITPKKPINSTIFVCYALPMQTMTQAAYARYRGVSKVTVLNWRRRGAITMRGDLVDVEASDKFLNGRPEKYRGGTATRRPGDR
jgi:hypothetical protein